MWQNKIVFVFFTPSDLPVFDNAPSTGRDVLICLLTLSTGQLTKHLFRHVDGVFWTKIVKIILLINNIPHNWKYNLSAEKTGLSSSTSSSLSRRASARGIDMSDLSQSVSVVVVRPGCAVVLWGQGGRRGTRAVHTSSLERVFGGTGNSLDWAAVIFFPFSCSFFFFFLLNNNNNQPQNELHDMLANKSPRQ